MLGSEDQAPVPSLLWSTLRTVGAIVAVSYGAMIWLSGSNLDRPATARLASSTFRGLEEPLTTGSISVSAASTRLDPCAAPRRP